MLSQVPAAEAKESSAIQPDEAHRGGECRQWEDHADPAADETEALPAELQAESCRYWCTGLEHQTWTRQEENGAERLGLLRLAGV